MKSHWLCVAFLLASLWNKAQHPSFYQLTVNNGLPSQEIYDVYQAKSGHMWFATNQGICRYDGYRVKTFSYPNVRSKSGSYICEDSSGAIYYGSFYGQIFKVQGDSIRLLSQHFQNSSGTPPFAITGNRLYIMQSDTLFEWDLYSNRNRHFQLPPNNIGTVEVLNGNIYLFNKDKVLQLHADGSYKTLLGENGVSLNGMNMLRVGNHLYLFSKQKSVVMLLNENQFRPVQLINSHLTGKGITNLSEDAEGNLWVSTFSGCYRADTDACLLPDKATSSLMPDRDGNTWLVTLFDGVYVFPSLKVMQFNTQNSPLSFNHLGALSADKDKYLWVATKEGTLHRLNIRQNEWEKVNVGHHSELTIADPNLIHGQILTGGIGLKSFDKESLKLKQMWPYAAVKDVTYMNAEAGLVATSGCCAYFSFSHSGVLSDSLMQYFRAIRHYRNLQTTDTTFLGTNRCSSVAYDNRTQDIWVAEADELRVLQRKGLRTIHDENGQPLSAVQIRIAPDGMVWVATRNKGLYAFEKYSIKHHFHAGNLLLSNELNLLRLYRDMVWVASEKGIQQLDIQHNTARNFTQQLETMNTDIFDFCIADYSLWVATSAGLQKIPLALKNEQQVPVAVISSIMLGDTELAMRAAYEFDHHQNSLRFEFSTLRYNSKAPHRFQYRMLGLNNNWQMLEAGSNSVQFPSLPPGNFWFEVMAVNNDGLHSAVPARVNVVIRPAFWQRWWFFAFIAFLISASVSIYYRFRLREQKKRSAQALQKALMEANLRQSQLSSLKVQMNPHFMFNALNSIQEFVMTNEKKQANMYLGKFSDLMRMTLDMSQRESISLSEEIRALYLYLELEALRYGDKLHWRIDVADGVAVNEIFIPALLIQPYAENALKHGLLHKKTDRQLSISFELSSNKQTLLCTIDDNGIGRQKSAAIKQFAPKKHLSFATSATQKRLELLNFGRKEAIAVKVEDKTNPRGESTGTKVVIEVPFVKPEQHSVN